MSTNLSPPTLQSLIADRWVGSQPASLLRSAIDGSAVAHTHAEAIDFAEAVHHAHRVGVPALLKLDFQQRAARLKALAAWLMERKAALYTLSRHSGATHADSWIDIEGGAGTLFGYASIGAGDLPSGNVVHEGAAMSLGKTGVFAGTHILVPRRGVAVHINAFNFPIWGLLEKFAPSFLAGMPCIAKPATATSYLTEAAVRVLHDSGLLPPGSLQLVIGGTGDLLDRLTEVDVVTFTGSADTAARLRVHPNLVARSVPFNAEADSLNCAVLAPEVGPDDEAFDLFVKEVAREMTAKAGQKCTAIRRAIVPRRHLDAVAERLAARLAKTVVGDPAVEGVKMGALASKAQQADVSERVALLARGNEVVFGAEAGRGPGAAFSPLGEGVAEGAFFSPTLLLCRDAFAHEAVHEVEAFGPVSTLMPYDELDEAVALAARGRGSLVSTLVTTRPQVAAYVVPQMAAMHGRVHILDPQAAPESTGHGSPLPQLKHGGPGRAGGGEELGGVRAVKHYLPEGAHQGANHDSFVPGRRRKVPRYGRWMAVACGRSATGLAQDAETQFCPVRLRPSFTHATVPDSSARSIRRHVWSIPWRVLPFGKRIAHGYFVLSAAAGLFVSPSPGPVLANYGLDTLRFVKPVGIGDTIQARLTCKRKIDKPARKGQPAQGVVAWDVQVSNQLGELVASYDILTLVLKRPGDGASAGA